MSEPYPQRTSASPDWQDNCICNICRDPFVVKLRNVSQNSTYRAVNEHRPTQQKNLVRIHIPTLTKHSTEAQAPRPHSGRSSRPTSYRYPFACEMAIDSRLPEHLRAETRGVMRMTPLQ